MGRLHNPLSTVQTPPGMPVATMVVDGVAAGKDHPRGNAPRQDVL